MHNTPVCNRIMIVVMCFLDHKFCTWILDPTMWDIGLGGSHRRGCAYRWKNEWSAYSNPCISTSQRSVHRVNWSIEDRYDAKYDHLIRWSCLASENFKRFIMKLSPIAHRCISRFTSTSAFKRSIHGMGRSTQVRDGAGLEPTDHRDYC